MPGPLHITRREDARSFMEGEELCREYVNTGKLLFGTSTLEVGKKGSVDPGHPHSHEVFFVVQGQVLLHTGDGIDYELRVGDAVLIPDGVPHALTNVGDTTAILSWSCAPQPVNF